MPRQAVLDDVNEHKRVRQREKARLRARLGIPDTSTPEFQAEAQRQASLIRGTPEDVEALDFSEAAGDFSGA